MKLKSKSRNNENVNLCIGTNAACYTFFDSNVALTSSEGSDIKQVKLNELSTCKARPLNDGTWCNVCLKRQTNHTAQESIVVIFVELIASPLPCY